MFKQFLNNYMIIISTCTLLATSSKLCKLLLNFVMSTKYAQLCESIELSSNSTWLLVGSWLFCLHNLPCLVNFWCTRGGSVEVWTKNILYQFLEGQTHFSTSWHAKMSLTLYEPISWNVLCSNLHTTSTHAPKAYQTWNVFQAKQPCPYQKSWRVRG
jgi:hypothetical protein